MSKNATFQNGDIKVNFLLVWSSLDVVDGKKVNFLTFGSKKGDFGKQTQEPDFFVRHGTPF